MNAFGVIHKGPVNDPTGLVQTARKAIRLKRGTLKPVAKPLKGGKYKTSGGF